MKDMLVIKSLKAFDCDLKLQDMSFLSFSNFLFTPRVLEYRVRTIDELI